MNKIKVRAIIVVLMALISYGCVSSQTKTNSATSNEKPKASKIEKARTSGPEIFKSAKQAHTDGMSTLIQYGNEKECKTTNATNIKSNISRIALKRSELKALAKSIGMKNSFQFVKMFNEMHPGREQDINIGILKRK